MNLFKFSISFKFWSDLVCKQFFGLIWSLSKFRSDFACETNFGPILSVSKFWSDLVCDQIFLIWSVIKFWSDFVCEQILFRFILFANFGRFDLWEIQKINKKFNYTEIILFFLKIFEVPPLVSQSRCNPFRPRCQACEPTKRGDFCAQAIFASAKRIGDHYTWHIMLLLFTFCFHIPFNK